jgi:hypothetical protein
MYPSVMVVGRRIGSVEGVSLRFIDKRRNRKEESPNNHIGKAGAHSAVGDFDLAKNPMVIGIGIILFKKKISIVFVII